MPTALICWLTLLAVTVPPFVSSNPASNRRLGLIALCPLGLGLACLLWGCLPTSSASERSEAAAFARSAETRLNDLKQAAEADPLNPDGWNNLSGAASEYWLRQPSHPDSAYELAVSAAQEAIRRDPRNAIRYRQLASLFWYRAQLKKSPPHARSAAEMFEQAIYRSPHRADLLADAAEASVLAENPNRARELARLALAQDDLNHQGGHSDKYLSESQKTRLLRLVETEG